MVYNCTYLQAGTVETVSDSGHHGTQCFWTGGCLKQVFHTGLVQLGVAAVTIIDRVAVSNSDQYRQAPLYKLSL